MRNFLTDESGAAFVIFALFSVVLIALGGGVLDYSRALTLNQRLSATADAAALNIKGLNLEQENAEDQARAERIATAFLGANYPLTEQKRDSVKLDPVKVVLGDALRVEFSGRVSTLFLPIIGISEFPASAVAVVAENQETVEVVLVLDNTGSMRKENKIKGLKIAARTLVDILFESDSVSIGLVPFAASVNVGRNTNRGWLDTHGRSPQHNDDDLLTGEKDEKKTLFDLHTTLKNSTWGGCVRARTGTDATRDTTPGLLGWVPLFAPAIDGQYENEYLSGNPKTYEDYEDKTPDLTRSSIIGKGPNYSCATTPIQPLTEQPATLRAAIKDMDANIDGNTAIPIGLVWGWRVISPTSPYIEGARYDEKKVKKVIILLTDGLNKLHWTREEKDVDTGVKIDVEREVPYSAYGRTQPTKTELDNYTTTICGNIKQEKITLFTVTFGTAHVDKDLMRRCASCPACYAHAPNNATLKKVFGEFARRIRRIRLVQ